MIRVFEAFAGIGTQRMALERLGIDHQVVAISEIDSRALAAYQAIHGDCPNLGDISKLKLEDIPDHDLFTYSFPCTDISTAGRQAGLEEGSGTRSSLLWECRRVIEGKRPKYLLLENVKNLVSAKHKPHFDRWLAYLSSLGYTNYYKVMNAKDYGNTPQNRERIFVVSILGDHDPFVFPEPRPCKTVIRDILEPEVGPRYDLHKPFLLKTPEKLFPTREQQQYILALGNSNPSGHGVGGNVVNADGLSPTLLTDGSAKVFVANQPASQTNSQEQPNWEHGKNIWCYATENPQRTVCPTQGCQGGKSAKCHFECLTPQMRQSASIETAYAHAGRIYDPCGLCPTLLTGGDTKVFLDGRIRRITEREAWRLMGVSDEDFEKAVAIGIPSTQLYRQAGNAIVVDVLEAIFGALFQH